MTVSSEAIVALSRFRAAVPPHRRAAYLPGEGREFAAWMRERPSLNDAEGDDDAEKLESYDRLIEDWASECPIDVEETPTTYETSLLAAVIEAP